MSLVGSTNAEKIWNYCKQRGLNDFGCSGVIANLDCESALNPKNLEDAYQARLGYTDNSYVDAVDTGRYNNFVHDCAGFGLVQWTWWTRKQALPEYACNRHVSIGDMEMQLDFMFKELQEHFPSVIDTLKSATTALQASNTMLLQYECPVNTGISVQNLRASYAQQYYDRFARNPTEGGIDMGYKIVTKKSNTKLSKHFNSNEFDCHGAGCCSQTKINDKLVEYLEKIRCYFGKPITITSGYRCPVHNRNVHGATGSRHGKGDAADIVIPGVRPADVAKYAESIGIKGIGLYETPQDGYFVHIDTREAKSFWYGQACSPRSTFGGVPSIHTETTEESKSYLLHNGSTGNAVRALQEKLVLLGYNISADGMYGPATEGAVRDYQKKNGLPCDGIAGPKTQKSIDDSVDKRHDGDANNSFVVRVTANVLNVRKGPGTNYPITGSIRDKGIYTITEKASGQGAHEWGRLSSGSGWIAMDYCIKE